MNTDSVNTLPVASVVIPAHNEERYLGATLQSIIDAFEGRMERCELVVVNDSSTDATKGVASRYGARVVDVELRNIGAVRNAGAAAATGEYLIFVDADTAVLPETIDATLKALDAGVLGGGASVALDDAKVPWYKYWIFPVMKTIWQRIGGWAAGCYMFCTAEVFREIEGFPEEYYAAEEYFFSRNIKRLGKFVVLSEKVVTSSRKLHDYSLWQLIRFVSLPFLTNPGNVLKSRSGLEVLYEHRRDSDGG